MRRVRHDRRSSVDWLKAQRQAARTARWAVTMAKVRIRQVLARTRWQLVTFVGPAGGESVGIVDLLAVRKDHSKPWRHGMKRGDAFQIVPIQVKGGHAAKPTGDHAGHLCAVARRYSARHVLLAIWRKGAAAQFFRLQCGAARGRRSHDWEQVADGELRLLFR
jgi:hypothetical protein